VSKSKSELATKKLEEFDSLLDYTQEFTSYPIPAPSQRIMPLYGSDYTLVATKCDCNLEAVDLQKILDIRDTLILKWEITSYALQLVAMHVQSSYLYWMIPVCVVGVIEECAAKFEHELYESGIIMTSVFHNRSSTNDNDILLAESYPFQLLHAKVNLSNRTVVCSIV